jgi:hypothetical protein
MNNGMSVVKIFRLTDLLHLNKRDVPAGSIVSPEACFPKGRWDK